MALRTPSAPPVLKGGFIKKTASGLCCPLRCSQGSPAGHLQPPSPTCDSQQHDDRTSPASRCPVRTGQSKSHLETAIESWTKSREYCQLNQTLLGTSSMKHDGKVLMPGREAPSFGVQPYAGTSSWHRCQRCQRGKGNFFWKSTLSKCLCHPLLLVARTPKSAQGSKGWANGTLGCQPPAQRWHWPRGQRAPAADSLLAGTDKEGKGLLNVS